METWRGLDGGPDNGFGTFFLGLGIGGVGEELETAGDEHNEEKEAAEDEEKGEESADEGADKIVFRESFGEFGGENVGKVSEVVGDGVGGDFA